MIYTKEQLQKFDLLDEGYADYIARQYKEAINFDRVADALDMADMIEQWYRANPEAVKENERLHSDYQIAAARLKWTALPILDNARTVVQYGGHINELKNMISELKLEPDFKFNDYFSEKLREKLQNIMIFEDRDSLKQQIRKALTENKEVLFDVKLDIDGKQEKSTIANWFKLYFANVGAGGIDKLKQTQFFTQNKVMQSLNKNQQEILRSIFETYEQIKISSYKEAGIETEVGFEDAKGEGTLIYGKLERYDPKKVKKFKNFIKTYEEIEGVKIPDDKVVAPPAGIAMQSSGQPMPPSAKPMATPKLKRLEDIQSHDLVKEQAHILTSSPKIKKAKKVANPGAVIEAVIVGQNLKFKNDGLKNRFENLCSTFLKGVRTNQELLAAFTKPEKNGGLDFNIDFANKIVNSIIDTAKDPQYQELPKINKPKAPEIKKPTFAEVKTKINTAPSTAPTPIPKKITPPKPAAPVPPAPKPVPKPAPMPKPRPIPKPAPPQLKPKPMPPAPRPQPIPKVRAPKMAPMPRMKRMAPSDKPMFTDIKSPTPMVMGPIDELRHMDIHEFRNLGAHSDDAAENILDKVNLLIKESVSKKAEGISAWKQSPLNNLYLEIGQKAMDQGKGIEEYLNKMSAQDPGMLTLEEFDAIADLNKNLRF
ncbi:hypothetical protein KKF29_02930 [Patescibacteria group bacterium]|nr:hypothetical protein [Patescibacteria group bacterium]